MTYCHTSYMAAEPHDPLGRGEVMTNLTIHHPLNGAYYGVWTRLVANPIYGKVVNPPSSSEQHQMQYRRLSLVSHMTVVKTIMTLLLIALHTHRVTILLPGAAQHHCSSRPEVGVIASNPMMQVKKAKKWSSHTRIVLTTTCTATGAGASRGDGMLNRSCCTSKLTGLYSAHSGVRILFSAPVSSASCNRSKQTQAGAG